MLAGCAGSCTKELPRPEAQRLLRDSAFLAKTTTTRLVLHRNRIFPASDLIAEHQELATFIKLGLVEVRPYRVLWGRPVGARVALTSRGEQAAASEWQRTYGPDGDEAWLIDTARRELLKVAKPAIRGETADCVFTWKWVPTSVGKEIGAPSKNETKATARFRLVGDQWYLDEDSIR